MTSRNIKIKDSRTYIEDDYQTAYQKARRELGPDLVQIDRKEIKVGGVFGFFAKKKTQVVFGIEAVEPASKYSKTQVADDAEILKFLQKLQNDQNVGGKVSNSIQGTNSAGTYNPYQKPQVQQPGGFSQLNQNAQSQTVQSVETKPKEEDIQKITEQIKKEVTEELKKELFKQGIGGEKESVKQNPIAERLRKNDIDEEFIPEITDFLEKNNFMGDNLLRGLKEYFYNNIETFRDFNNKKVIMLVGPTGVGKTTSCAKIAANKWKEEKEIAFITADTYRLEAVTQLKGYANIMKVNVEVVNKPEELTAAIDKFRTKDFVIMDTAGRSPRNKQQMDELKEYVKNSRNSDIDVYLVLSATSKLDVLYDIIENFKYIGFSSFIFTKIDETTSIGAILSIYKKYKIPVSYVTTGQRVPDDIEIADKSRLADIFIERLK